MNPQITNVQIKCFSTTINISISVIYQSKSRLQYQIYLINHSKLLTVLGPEFNFITVLPIYTVQKYYSLWLQYLIARMYWSTTTPWAACTQYILTPRPGLLTCSVTCKLTGKDGHSYRDVRPAKLTSSEVSTTCHYYVCTNCMQHNIQMTYITQQNWLTFQLLIAHAH